MGFFKKLGNFLISKRFLINLGLIVILWIIIIWGSKSYFKSYTHHGEIIEVPDFLTNNVDDIPQLIGDKELQYEVLDSIYNPNLLEGTVVYQNPMPTDSTGVGVKPNRVIRVRVSKRSRLVNVPNVVSKSLRFAEAVLKTKGLRTHVRYVPSNEDQGVVITQKIKGKDVMPEDRTPINSVVELTVGKISLGSLVTVPDLSGLTINEAKARFGSSSDLRLYSVCIGCFSNSDSLKARVIRQTPIASDSSKVPQGSTITIFASPEDGLYDDSNNDSENY